MHPRTHVVVGDRTAGRFVDSKQGSLVRVRNGVQVERCKIRVETEEPLGARRQSAHSSGEASKDRGAKGRRKGRGVSDKQPESKSAAVPVGAKQAEEIHVRWAWVERSVWSARMLQTLETGAKGGQWPNASFEQLGLYP